jgi:5'-AMP-activated protein kinase catalytic alpha subunit
MFNVDHIISYPSNGFTSFAMTIDAETADFVTLSIPRQFGNYTVHKVIGQGSTSVVDEVTDRSSGKDYAAKVMSHKDLRTRNIYQMVEREVRLLRRLSHEHLLHFHELVSHGDLLFIVTENCSGGDLLSWILEGRLKQKSTMKRLFYEVVMAVKYLHGQGIAHNDIKPENVMIDGCGRARLVDFGLANDRLIGGEDAKCGTLMYAAPELLRSGQYHTQKADIWSLGILLYGMATGKFPFDGQDDREIVRQIRQGKLKFPRSMDSNIKAMIRRLTTLNANERPTITTIAEDCFFDEVRLFKQTKQPKQQKQTALAALTAREMELSIW